ncbi:hypothetical protein QOT17_007424 [Balamuthia mandrillaris]
MGGRNNHPSSFDSSYLLKASTSISRTLLASAMAQPRSRRRSLACHKALFQDQQSNVVEDTIEWLTGLQQQHMEAMKEKWGIDFANDPLSGVYELDPTPTSSSSSSSSPSASSPSTASSALLQPMACWTRNVPLLPSHRHHRLPANTCRCGTECPSPTDQPRTVMKTGTTSPPPRSPTRRATVSVVLRPSSPTLSSSPSADF